MPCRRTRASPLWAKTLFRATPAVKSHRLEALRYPREDSAPRAELRAWTPTPVPSRNSYFGQRRKLRLTTAMCAFPRNRTRLSRLSVHALVHDRLDLHDDLVGDGGVSVMSREGSGGIRDDRVDCNRELMAVRLNFRSPDLTCAPSNPEYQLMAKRVAHRVPKPWTKQDVRELKTHSRARTPVVKVSKSMKRTVGALRRRAGILGIGLGHRR